MFGKKFVGCSEIFFFLAKLQYKTLRKKSYTVGKIFRCFFVSEDMTNLSANSFIVLAPGGESIPRPVVVSRLPWPFDQCAVLSIHFWSIQNISDDKTRKFSWLWWIQILISITSFEHLYLVACVWVYVCVYVYICMRARLCVVIWVVVRMSVAVLKQRFYRTLVDIT